ncbi:hypothetical protein PV05_05847 [Exophiala xenobiotica]|uniref:Uncharacterized protein n=1 Tax=Exophiala xenobiotica TaxID=348802 RepID=A0A0D2ERA3_9EURO|nr:uncharacterized protein PV05_05847 [Exophiala xenobiotica]KIW57275.1 hypothetical protein PV05_05847 [Exophiala xenobiotica]
MISEVSLQQEAVMPCDRTKHPGDSICASEREHSFAWFVSRTSHCLKPKAAHSSTPVTTIYHGSGGVEGAAWVPPCGNVEIAREDLAAHRRKEDCALQLHGVQLISRLQTMQRHGWQRGSTLESMSQFQQSAT